MPFIPVLLRSSSHNSGIFCCGGAIDRDGRKVGEGAERFVPSLSLSLADRTNTLAEGNGRQKTARVHDDDDCLAAGVAVSPLPLLLLLMMVIIIVLLRYKQCTITTLPPRRDSTHNTVTRSMQIILVVAAAAAAAASTLPLLSVTPVVEIRTMYYHHSLPLFVGMDPTHYNTTRSVRTIRVAVAVAVAAAAAAISTLPLLYAATAVSTLPLLSATRVLVILLIVSRYGIVLRSSFIVLLRSSRLL